MIHAHIIYSGRVQGVGFRYTVEDYATSLDLSGWVKNLPDGRVEMRVEGHSEKIEQLCQQIEAHFKNYIRHKEFSVESDAPKGSFKDFHIAF